MNRFPSVADQSGNHWTQQWPRIISKTVAQQQRLAPKISKTYINQASFDAAIIGAYLMASYVFERSLR